MSGTDVRTTIDLPPIAGEHYVASTPQRPRQNRRRTWIAIAAVAALTAASGAAVWAYDAVYTDVTVVVDGQARELRVPGSTVDKALAAADLTVSDEDLIAPALGTTIADGASVEVVRARPITLTLDGSAQRRKLPARTVGEALDLLSLPGDVQLDGVTRGTPIALEGISFTGRTPVAMRVLVDGATKEGRVAVGTVREALAAVGITVDGDDIVTPALDGPLPADGQITIVRVETQERDRKEPIAFERNVTVVPTMAVGAKEVVTPGKPGELIIRERVTLHDGKVVNSTELSRSVGTKPVAQVEKAGPTAGKPAPPAPAEGGPAQPGAPAPGPEKPAPAAPSGSVWDRLAQCESGGNWSMNTGNGYYGGLQFSAATWRAMGMSGLPHQASRETQIAAATKLQAKYGWGQWPACSKKLGLR